MKINNLKAYQEMLKKRIAPIAVAGTMAVAGLGLTGCSNEEKAETSENSPAILAETILEDSYLLANSKEYFDIVVMTTDKKFTDVDEYKSIFTGNTYNVTANNLAPIVPYLEASDVKLTEKEDLTNEDVFNLAKGILDRANEAVQESKKEKTK